MPLFHRLSTSGKQRSVWLEDQYAGTTRSTCWLIGGGPSLSQLPTDQIAASPCPKLAVNLSGCGLIRPTFWTSYDPTVRFHRSIYLDAGITKFVHRRRAMDLVPETTFKVCECPATYVFDRDGARSYDHLLDPQAAGIIDWSDSLAQGIDILYRLGFRRLLLAGCDLCVTPSTEVVELARQRGVEYQPGELLQEFFQRCTRASLNELLQQESSVGAQYHFDERKSLAAAIATDAHYFRIVQYLRLSRRNLALHGVELISVTPGSRLNGFFPYLPVKKVLQELRTEIGDPAREPTRGLYTEQLPRRNAEAGPMRDYRSPGSADPKRAQDPVPPVPAGELIVEREGWTPFAQRAYAAPIEEG
ncbi:MAG TPA: hypothetical protein VL132_05095 [Planctomycetaceae bacterium]|nr:hypothetical protein [Planctomycetaceae bacterium]